MCIDETAPPAEKPRRYEVTAAHGQVDILLDLERWYTSARVYRTQISEYMLFDRRPPDEEHERPAHDRTYMSLLSVGVQKASGTVPGLSLKAPDD
jgi:hypothetical protein